MLKFLIHVFFVFMVLSTQGQQKLHQMWDNKPAKNWMSQAYPIGNGRIGAMIYGGVRQEHIQFNENSLWTGDEKETGAYQAFGDIFVRFIGKSMQDSVGYKRVLDIDNALHKINYVSGQLTFERTYFASHPDQVLVFDYTAKGRGVYSGEISLVDAHGARTEEKNNALLISSRLENGLLYSAKLWIQHQGGSITVDAEGTGKPILRFKNVDRFTIYLAAATNYSPIRESKWKGENPELKNERTTALLKGQKIPTLQSRHINDYKSLYDRFKLQIGALPSLEELSKPTRERIIDYKRRFDPNLEILLLQYGRYLLISSSRPGSLPANLQGLWNNSNNPPWRSDYHSNINVQMNYWLAEPANLAECHIPYLDYINVMREVKKVSTQLEYPGVRGWTVRTENNIFGGESFLWNTPGSAWYAQALWEHYAFNQDKNYLRKFAYPILKEISEFWDDHLKHRQDGTLVAPDGWSPEHGPREDGVSYDQQIVFDLFTNYIEAADSLSIDKKYRDHIFGLKERLLKPKIGKWGQLQEWEEDKDEPNNKHRHVSHLFALHPGRQIGVNRTPELAQAAKVSLTARGDASTGWSMAWKMNFWARLQDGNHAYKILNNFVTLALEKGDVNYSGSGGIYENMLCAHPPFQIDGNFGYVAGVTEMLVQSQEGIIDLLPAIPDAWASEGKVKGLRVRGNMTLGMVWKDGKVISYDLVSPTRKRVEIKVNGVLKNIIIGPKRS